MVGESQWPNDATRRVLSRLNLKDAQPLPAHIKRPLIILTLPKMKSASPPAIAYRFQELAKKEEGGDPATIKEVKQRRAITDLPRTIRGRLCVGIILRMPQVLSE